MKMKLQKEESNLTLFLRKFIKCKQGYLLAGFSVSKTIMKQWNKMGLTR